MKKQILILTEADEKVASGHLKECIVLYEELKKRCYDLSLWVNEDIPIGFQESICFSYSKYLRPIYKGIEDVILYIQNNNVKLVILNLRKVDNELILKIKSVCQVKILCIDELGQRRLDCDIIVNPMVNKLFGVYDGSYEKKYVGNEYLVLPVKFHEWNQKDKSIRSEIKEITISMGGVDINNHTALVVQWLNQQRELQDIVINVVLGGGYLYSCDLYKLKLNPKVRIFQNIDYLDQLFYESDLAFCAGGNTLHELACIGTTAIVIPTMPHEYKNGKKFEELGFGKCYHDFEEFREKVGTEFCRYFDQSMRKKSMESGKKCSDGAGYLRMIEIVELMLSL